VTDRVVFQRSTNNALVVIVISAAHLGCSQVVEVVVDPEPGIDDARAFVEEAVARNSDRRLKMISVTKTGGRRLKGAEGDSYELWYNVTVELTEDALWSPSAFKRFSTQPAGSLEGVLFYAGKTGEEVTIPGTLSFRKDKSSWTIQKDERY
jgi:hypothetical protein